jgi:hypothetical protein
MIVSRHLAGGARRFKSSNYAMLELRIFLSSSEQFN